jgi:predicted dehydrogenase
VFAPEHSYPDHQTLNIQFSNGVLSTFTVVQCQPATRRTIHVIGSDARLYGVLNDNCMRVFRHGKLGTEVVETIHVYPDESGHNGGDSILSKDFFDLLQGRRNPERPGLREGIEASILCLAADQSAASGMPVRLDSIRHQVFDGVPAVPHLAGAH